MNDFSQRFLFDDTDVRGEMVALRESYAHVLAKHAYPQPVAQLLGEMMAAAALLVGTLKFDGLLVLQARSEGPLSLLMVECSSARELRGIARYEAEQIGADADLPVPRRMVTLARERGLFLHAHSDAEAVERLFAQWPQARILWAHSGFESPDKVRELLRRHKNLWCDLAFRSEHGSAGKVAPEWRAVFTEFPDRFMVGTDTFTPERWHYVVEHARWSRQWLADLPPACIVTCQFDPLRDEGAAYAFALQAAGNQVQHIQARGHTHTSLSMVDVVVSGEPVRAQMAAALRGFFARAAAPADAVGATA